MDATERFFEKKSQRCLREKKQALTFAAAF
jgi:hypothetical protein